MVCSSASVGSRQPLAQAKPTTFRLVADLVRNPGPGVVGDVRIGQIDSAVQTVSS
jgi:hypothetical protein